MTIPRRLALLASLAIFACVRPASSSGPAGAGAGGSASNGGLPAAIDPQRVRDQDDMTWDDFKPIPSTDWANPAVKATKRTMRVAILAGDFSDMPFVITKPKGSDPFGNPRVDPITRDEVPKFYADFYGTPNANNHGHTVNEYWMEQSRGQIGATVDGFGPYRVPGHYYQYGFDGGNTVDIPGGLPARNGPRELDSLWRAAVPDSIALKYDLVVRMFAGYDETATWQEFGEMKFQNKEDITPEWGNPDTTKNRWVKSRYVPWTSWLAGVWMWSNGGGGKITQGETINSIRHEIAHAAFAIGDNYNNPYAEPYRRTHAGPWDLMDRGSFNGPGGPHSRFVLPPNAGGQMAAGVMLRQKMFFKFVDSSQVLLLNRDGLAQTGVAMTEVTARAAAPLPGTRAGILIRLDGATPQDRTPFDDPGKNPISSGTANFNTYTVEVVQRIGTDSYEPDNGVLIAKNKDAPSGPFPRPAPGAPQPTNNMAIFTWVIDAHPENINRLDFKRPNGDPVMRTVGDYRQLNDALFHAGNNSGSFYEWEDTPNRLHFYIVDVHHDPQGVLSYTIAVRSLDGAGPHQRGVSLTPPGSATTIGSRGSVSFTLGNTGKAAPIPATAHPRDVTANVAVDVYRISASVEGDGWTAQLQNPLAAIGFGATHPVPVFVEHTASAAKSAVVVVTARSESDPTKTATVRYPVTR